MRAGLRASDMRALYATARPRMAGGLDRRAQSLIDATYRALALGYLRSLRGGSCRLLVGRERLLRRAPGAELRDVLGGERLRRTGREPGADPADHEAARALAGLSEEPVALAALVPQREQRLPPRRRIGRRGPQRLEVALHQLGAPRQILLAVPSAEVGALVPRRVEQRELARCIRIADGAAHQHRGQIELAVRDGIGPILVLGLTAKPQLGAAGILPAVARARHRRQMARNILAWADPRSLVRILVPRRDVAAALADLAHDLVGRRQVEVPVDL